MNTTRNHRYALARYQGMTTKCICPNCGKRSFVRYIDTATGQVLSEDCGRCDHEQSCGYHYTPRQFFSDNPQEWQERASTRVPYIYKPQPDTVDFGHVSIWDSRQRGYEKYGSDFAQALGYYFDTETVHRLVDIFHLQSYGEHRNVMFPNIDKNGIVRDIAVVGYKSDLHRNNIGFYYRGHKAWQERMQAQHPNGYKYGFCFYGEHLLPRYPWMPVALAESQKSAAVCSAVYPEFIWLATCGSNRFKSEYCTPLKGRKVVVYPDKGCEAKWGATADALRAKGYDISLNPIMQKFPQYGDNSDICDVVLDELRQRKLPLSKEELTLQYHMRKPHVAELVNGLGLTLA